MNTSNSTVGCYTMNTTEAAEFIGCSAYTLRELCRKREIPFARLGNSEKARLVFTAAALKTWISKQEERNWKY